MANATKWKQRLVVTVVAGLVGAYDLWAVRVAGDRFTWGRDLPGYYDLLGRAFTAGHTYLPVQPSPQLLAQPNPWDPGVDQSLKLHDAVLFNRRYYLYYGAAPAVLLFTPWRLLTGHDLPQNFAVFLLAFGGFLFACGALLRLLELAGARPGWFVLALLVLALGICQGVPYLLNRPEMYEVAIACGYFSVSGGVFFLAWGVASRRTAWLAASGLMFGLAVASRPHLVLTGLVAATALATLFARRKGVASVLRSQAFLAFCVAYAMVGATVAAYNYSRFGSPFEFGLKYHLGGPGQNRLDLASRNLVPGLYFMLLSRPELSPVFPWMRMVFRFPFDSADRYPLPAEYFVEPSVGALWIAPFVLAALFIPSARRLSKHSIESSPAELRTVLWTATAGCLAVLLFLISNHFATHRYEVDFLPLGVCSAVTALGIYVSTAKGIRRRVPTVLLAGLVLYSAVANLVLGIGGPYFDFLKNRPKNYVRLAGWFSPVWETRPLINPAIRVRLAAAFNADWPGFRAPLITIGHSHYTYFLYAELARGKLRLVSQSGDSTMSYEMADPRPRPLAFGMTYFPETRKVSIAVDGTEVLTHPVDLLITAPAQVAVGENFSDLGLTSRRFPGRVDVVERTVFELRPSADRPAN